MQSQDIANLTINKLTQEQYDNITPSETELYLITDAEFDSVLDSTSDNAVKNSVITAALDDKQDKLTAGSGISISGSTISVTASSAVSLSALTDVTITSVSNGQGLVYDTASGKWVNGDVSSTSVWGSITGTLSDQTDLNNALSGKANISHSHTVSDITDLAIPSNISELNNDSGFITSVSWNDVNNKPDTFTPASHNQASNTINALTGYIKLTETSALSASDNLNTALGKLEKALDGKQGSGSYAAEDHTHVMADITDLDIPTITDTFDASSSDGMSGKAVASAISGKVDTSSLSNYVPTTRTVNGKALSGNVTLSASDVNALPSDTVIPSNTSDLNNDSGFITESAIPTNVSDFNNDAGYLTSTSLSDYAKTSELADVAFSNSYEDLDNKPTIPTTYSDVGAASSAHTHNYSYTDVGAASVSHTHSDYVPKTTQINSKTLTGDITLSASDIGALPDTTVIPVVPTNVSAFNNDAGYITDISSKANASETYTKSEIDGKLSGAMHFKGTANTVGVLPSEASVGDMYNVKSTGANYAWDGESWDKLSENIDLSEMVPNSRTVNGKALSSDITLTYTDVNALSASTSIPSTYSDIGAASASHTHTYSYTDVGAASASHTHSDYVPNTTKINDKTLSGDITLSASDIGALDSSVSIPTTYSDVGAASASHTHTYSEVGAASSSHTHSGYVSTSTKINNQALSSDVTLSASDVGALPDDTTIPTTYSDVGAASENHTHSNYVSTSRKINNKDLTADITLSASDIGALPSDTVIPSTASDVNALPADTAIPSNTSDLNNDSGFISSISGGTGISVSGTTINHSNSITSGTAGTDSATSGDTVSIPYVTYDSEGHITLAGTHTHTITGFALSNHSHTYNEVGAASEAHTHTYSDVGAASASHSHASSEITALTSYAIATASSSLSTSDTLNEALGKLEYKVNNASGGGGSITVGQLAG